MYTSVVVSRNMLPKKSTRGALRRIWRERVNFDCIMSVRFLNRLDVLSVVKYTFDARVSLAGAAAHFDVPRSHAYLLPLASTAHLDDLLFGSQYCATKNMGGR